MLEYPGRDRVNLEVRSSGRRILMELPVVSTGYCDDLRERCGRPAGAGTPWPLRRKCRWECERRQG